MPDLSFCKVSLGLALADLIWNININIWELSKISGTQNDLIDMIE